LIDRILFLVYHRYLIFECAVVVHCSDNFGNIDAYYAKLIRFFTPKNFSPLSQSLSILQIQNNIKLTTPKDTVYSW